ncbi:MAG: arginine repressor [Ruminococcaceae bacterium]|nr:arginine repressor [Oscillospiraceae bacterium]
MQEKDCIKNSKKQRHNTIVRIISEKAVETQGQLTKLLIAEGFDVTQATVSRDIKELRLIKIADRGDKYRYALPGKETDMDIRSRYTAVLTHAVITIQNASNLVVVKTIPGSAQGCAMAIETLGFDKVVGVIAGDDTVFIAMNSEKDAADFCKTLMNVIN